MTRKEFDTQIRDLKKKRNDILANFTHIQADLKEEIAIKYRDLESTRKEISKLKQALTTFTKERIHIEAEWNEKIHTFIKENESSTTSNLAEAPTTNIIYELRRRGFHGIIRKNKPITSEDDTYDSDEESYDLSKQFTNED